MEDLATRLARARSFWKQRDKQEEEGENNKKNATVGSKRSQTSNPTAGDRELEKSQNGTQAKAVEEGVALSLPTDQKPTECAYSALDDLNLKTMDTDDNSVCAKIAPSTHTEELGKSPEPTGKRKDLFGSRNTMYDTFYEGDDSAVLVPYASDSSPSAYAIFEDRYGVAQQSKETTYGQVYEADEDLDSTPSGHSSYSDLDMEREAKNSKLRASLRDSYEDDDDEDQSVGYAEKDWNSDFQRILAMKDGPEKYLLLTKLAHDFVYAAETYGKVIISELGLPVEKKTVKPVAAGGQAGGEKYVVQGIFFKFALDIYGIYGGDEYAMKAASHDLKGLLGYFGAGIPDLHLPLMALIDYMGFRLIALSILPVNKDTLCYGSCDGGVTVMHEDKNLNQLMEQAAAKMNIKAHKVGLPGTPVTTLSAPVDIEGHLGTDGKYYVLDFARVFPAQRPTETSAKRKGVILYQLLRPELVKNNLVPLSSDAFTAWSKVDENKAVHNSEVEGATKRMFSEAIPAVAAKLDDLLLSSFNAPKVDIVQELHTAGINCRHLGRVRRSVSGYAARTECLREMVARTMKRELQALMRSVTRNSGIPSEEPAREVVVKFFNKVLGSSHKSERYWKETLKEKLMQQFEFCLFPDELNPDLSLDTTITVPQLVIRVANITGIKISASAKSDVLNSRNKDHFLAGCDIVGFDSTVKHMNLVDVAEGMATLYEAIEGKNEGYQERALTLALAHLERAARRVYFDPNVLCMLGDILAENHHPDKASKAYDAALLMEPNFIRAILGLASVTLSQAVAPKALYEKAIALEPDNFEAHFQYGDYLARWPSYAPDAIGHLENAIRIDPQSQVAHLILARAILTTYTKKLTADAGEYGIPRETLARVGELFETALAKDEPSKKRRAELKRFMRQDSAFVSAFGKPREGLYLLFIAALRSPRLMKIVEKELARTPEIALHIPVLHDDTLMELTRRCKDLKLLHLKECPLLTSVSLAECPFNELQSLKITLSPGLTSNKLIDSLLSKKGYNNIENLKLLGCSITNDALLQLVQLKQLRYLHLADNDQLEDDAIIQLLESNTRLNRLGIFNCPGFTDKGLYRLPAYMEKLALGGENCGLTEEALRKILPTMTNIEKLSLKGMHNLGAAVGLSLTVLCPSLLKFVNTKGLRYLFTGNKSMDVRLLVKSKNHIEFLEREGRAQLCMASTSGSWHPGNDSVIKSGGATLRMRIQTASQMGHIFYIIENNEPVLQVVRIEGGMLSSWQLRPVPPSTVMPSNITSVSMSRGIERIIIFGPTGAKMRMLGEAYMLLPPATNITLTCAMVFILFPFASE